MLLNVAMARSYSITVCGLTKKAIDVKIQTMMTYLRENFMDPSRRSIVLFVPILVLIAASFIACTEDRPGMPSEATSNATTKETAYAEGLKANVISASKQASEGDWLRVQVSFQEYVDSSKLADFLSRIDSARVYSVNYLVGRWRGVEPTDASDENSLRLLGKKISADILSPMPRDASAMASLGTSGSGDPRFFGVVFDAHRRDIVALVENPPKLVRFVQLVEPPYFLSRPVEPIEHAH